MTADLPNKCSLVGFRMVDYNAIPGVGSNVVVAVSTHVKRELGLLVSGVFYA